MDMLKLLAAAWIGACIRNEEDRKKTLGLFNSLGIETEKLIKGFFRGDTTHVQSEQPKRDEQEFI